MALKAKIVEFSVPHHTYFRLFFFPSNSTPAGDHRLSSHRALLDLRLFFFITPASQFSVPVMSAVLLLWMKVFGRADRLDYGGCFGSLVGVSINQGSKAITR